MTDMRRYDYDTIANSPLKYRADVFVLASDAEAAIAAAEQRGMRQAHDSVPALQQYGIEKYHEGQRDAIAAAVQRVEALFKNAHRLMSDGHYSYVVPDSADVIAAIKGESEPGYCPQCRDRTDFHYQDDDGRWFCRHCLCDYAIEGDNDGSV